MSILACYPTLGSPAPANLLPHSAELHQYHEFHSSPCISRHQSSKLCSCCPRRLELPTPKWLARANAERPEHRRTSLPKPAQAEKSVSLWSIIKDVVGKDLTRVCLPVYFNEPLSALQRTAEDLEYSELVDEVRLMRSPGLNLSAAVSRS